MYEDDKRNTRRRKIDKRNFEFACCTNFTRTIVHIKRGIDFECNHLGRYIAAVHNKSWIIFVKAAVKGVGQDGALISPFHSLAVQNGGRASAGLKKASAEEKRPRRAPLRKSLARPRPAEAGLANVTTVSKSHILRQQITHFSRVFSIFPSICGDMNISNASDEKDELDVMHTKMDWNELKLNPNFQVNRNRKLTNALKDGRLIKTLINQPIPPNMPLIGLNLLDAISDAHSV
ncbi:Protein CBG24866 [Caenorhabditis briggsae]|uniref:Protein CBG24866 n=1 Tax=Caenorhabditis briggsae TaxID=6238 RepID=A8WLN2_CAEBR|nr:Protein CBG24866 [Caenorhabditis briggsae]CAP21378.1 Protein CBG24866 [Caenorhabditis briggsae]